MVFFFKVFQKEQLLAGDFYSQWLKCESETEKVGTAFAKILSSCLKNRVQQLTNNDFFRSAIFLDPRCAHHSPLPYLFYKNFFFLDTSYFLMMSKRI